MSERRRRRWNGRHGRKRAIGCNGVKVDGWAVSRQLCKVMLTTVHLRDARGAQGPSGPRPKPSREDFRT
jgi:hypothetical protein